MKWACYCGVHTVDCRCLVLQEERECRDQGQGWVCSGEPATGFGQDQHLLPLSTTCDALSSFEGWVALGRERCAVDALLICVMQCAFLFEQILYQ